MPSKKLSSVFFFFREEVVTKIVDFVTLNGALDFRKLVYLPYRSIEPSDEQRETEVKSWGGVVLCLQNHVDLSMAAVNCTEQVAIGKVEQFTSPKSVVSAFKMFVDVSTSRASIGDWRQYQKELQKRSMDKKHIDALKHGLVHELRLIHNVAGALCGTTPEVTKSPEYIKFVHDCEAGVTITESLFDSYALQSTHITVTELNDYMTKLLCWTDFSFHFDFKEDHELAFSLKYCLAELCRNVYRWGKANSDGVKFANCVFQNTELWNSVTIISDANPDRQEINYPDQLLDHHGGLYIVNSLVNELPGGKFNFTLKDSRATAMIKYNN